MINSFETEDFEILINEESEYMCCLHETPRNSEWCIENCPKQSSCDTYAWAGDEQKLLDGEAILLLRVCADPSGIYGYSSSKLPTKILKTYNLLRRWGNERVAIGVRHIFVVNSYEKYIRAEFPDRPIFIITGGNTSFRKRREIIDELAKTPNGILISTQQALSASTNIDFVDKVLLPELHYNNAAMSQYYFRFIRYTSKNWKQVYFLTYENTIESNVLKMMLVKEKLNLFMKNEILDDDELYEQFGVDPAMINNLMSKEYDEQGRVHLRWGEQKIS